MNVIGGASEYCFIVSYQEDRYSRWHIQAVFRDEGMAERYMKQQEAEEAEEEVEYIAYRIEKWRLN